MPDDIIDLAEYQREEHKRLLHLREIFLEQERNEMNGELPCISRRLTALDHLLMEDPLTDLNLRTVIVARVAYISARMYEEEPEPIIKDFLQLWIRRHHRQFMKLPKRYSEALAPIWSKWLDVLEEEEREWKELADA